MWDLIVSVPDHCLSFYFTYMILISTFRRIIIIIFVRIYTHLPITRMRNRDQYRMSIREVSGFALEESKNAHLL